MMTLREIIDAYEQRQAERRADSTSKTTIDAAPSSDGAPTIDYVPAAVALTPRGDVNVALWRLRQLLGRLDDEDRRHTAGQLQRLLAEIAPEAITA